MRCVEIDHNRYVNLDQVCHIKLEPVLDGRGELIGFSWVFSLSNGEVARSIVFNSKTQAEEWFNDEVKPIMKTLGASLSRRPDNIPPEPTKNVRVY